MIVKPFYFPKLERRSHYSVYRKYSEYKAEIREDCKLRCVYCDTHEKEIGGAELMQLDHFRPQKHFPMLLNEPTNLVWSCGRCNRLKWHDFPLETDEQTIGYLDPFQVERNEYFSVGDDGGLVPLQDPATYMIDRLALNRDFLRFVRRKRFVLYELFQKCLSHFDEQINDITILLESETQENKIKRLNKMSKRCKMLQELLIVTYEHFLSEN